MIVIGEAPQLPSEFGIATGGASPVLAVVWAIVADRWPMSASPREQIPLVDFDIGRPDHLAPLLGFGGYEPSEIGGRARKRRRTQIREPRLYVGFGKRSVDLLVQLADDFGGRVPWCGDPEPITSLEARSELA